MATQADAVDAICAIVGNNEQLNINNIIDEFPPYSKMSRWKHSQQPTWIYKSQCLIYILRINPKPASSIQIVCSYSHFQTLPQVICFCTRSLKNILVKNNSRTMLNPSRYFNIFESNGTQG